MLPERVDTLVGSMLGKDDRVLQGIGTGGMAVVYLGAANHVMIRGTGFGSLASCAAGVLGGIHIQQIPDTGAAQVFRRIRFRPL